MAYEHARQINKYSRDSDYHLFKTTINLRVRISSVYNDKKHDNCIIICICPTLNSTPLSRENKMSIQVIGGGG